MLAVRLVVLAAWCAAGAALQPELRGTYEVQSTVLLGELRGARPGLGYRLRGALRLQPAAADPAQRSLLLACRLVGVELQVLGPGARAEWASRASTWAAHADVPFHALRAAGRLRAFLDPALPPDVLGYLRALLSLLQFQVEDGEYKETDVSGECDVLYETISPTVFRKTKRRCAFEAEGAGAVGARRVARYELRAPAGPLAALHAEEVLRLAHGAPDTAPGLQVRSWHELTLREELPARPALGPDALQAALDALPPAFRETPLPLPLDDDHDHNDDDDEKEDSLEAAVEKHRAALEGWEAGEGGSRAQAAALAPLLRALRAAPEPALRDLLLRADPQHRLAGVCRALGLLGTGAAWRAARDLLALGAHDALAEPALRYLGGLALAAAPDARVAAGALALGEEARRPSVRGAALLAGAAAAGRAGERAARAALERLARGLARCGDRACRAHWARALGAVRHALGAPALLAAAERGAGAEAEAALRALRALPPRSLEPGTAERAARLAGNSSRSLAVRARALELAVELALARGAPSALPARLARALEDAPELRRALTQLLQTLAPDAPLPEALRTWDVPAGTTRVLERSLPWGGAGWRGSLRATLLAERGVLRRGTVALHAQPERGPAPRDALLEVHVWTRGLEAMTGGEEDPAGGAPEDEQEEGAEDGTAAGLRVAVAGAPLPPVRLFSGRAELVGHVWAGTGSAPTPVQRALLPLRSLRLRVPLQAGAVLALRADATGALALDAQAHASLWQRSARARLSLRAALHAELRAELRCSWARLQGSATAAGEARLRISPELDFYDGVALCVRVHVEPHDAERAVRLRARGGARYARTTRERRAGRTLALGRGNDAACRVLRARHPDEDEP